MGSLQSLPIIDFNAPPPSAEKLKEIDFNAPPPAEKGKETYFSDLVPKGLVVTVPPTQKPPEIDLTDLVPKAPVATPVPDRVLWHVISDNEKTFEALFPGSPKYSTERLRFGADIEAHELDAIREAPLPGIAPIEEHDACGAAAEHGPGEMGADESSSPGDQDTPLP